MGDVTKWDAGQLQELEGNLRSAHAAVEETTSSLERDIEARLQDWEGGAREAYQVARAEWNAQIQKLNEILQQLGVAIQQIQEQYVASEQRNTSLFG
jgi:WXG100 family type VII secretion target